MDLVRELEKTKAALFKDSNAAFYGTLMCHLSSQFEKDSEHRAYTDGKKIAFEPEWFSRISENVRKATLLHELEHVARLHILRRGSRGMKRWVAACDMVINRDLFKNGHTFEEESVIECPPEFMEMAEEQIYDELMKKPDSDFENVVIDMAEGDISSMEQASILGNVMAAVHAAKAAGNQTGRYEEIIKAFTKVKVNWATWLQQYCNDVTAPDRTWKVRNPLYKHVLAKGKMRNDEALSKIVFFQDCSGSVDAEELAQANAEAQHIKRTFQPKEMRIVQFDTDITNEILVDESDELDELKIVGRGGTSLTCVREWIQENKPNVAVVFSDLECAPMEELDVDCDVLWVVVRSGIVPPFGKYIHI